MTSKDESIKDRNRLETNFFLHWRAHFAQGGVDVPLVNFLLFFWLLYQFLDSHLSSFSDQGCQVGAGESLASAVVAHFLQIHVLGEFWLCAVLKRNSFVYLFAFYNRHKKATVLQNTFVNARKMSSRSEASGKPMYRTLSSLPGRRSAGSTTSGRLVAAMMDTPCRPSMPSISVSIWLTILDAELSPSDLLGHKASISSKNMVQGAEFLALVKHCLTAFSLSPTYCGKTKQN